MPIRTEDIEKLGSFYLGRTVDDATRAATETPFLYDMADLTTHAVIVGMTGSGKTGLGIALLEEAAIDGVPALVVDPKGDLTNLALQFPDLAPADFQPWVSPEQAARAGVSVEAFSISQAALWKSGLEKSGQDGERIRRLQERSEVTIYTPGSTAGVPVSVVGSFAPPAQGVLSDPELLAGHIETTVGGLLGLLGLSVDASRSREAVLLAMILRDAWERNETLDMHLLVQRIQRPRFTRVGVLDLESFYPEKDRFQLVMALNNLLASPGFEVWMQGVPLHVQDLLYTPEGKPRLAVFSIAHLGDAERMFFVSMLLGATLSWMRSQSGTTSLRALFYMDEIFGFFPPTANPPSKKPLLTLMKQARAFGLGVVVATQNPVDLDYKGLSNAGTWFIGRLQAERDKARLLDGLTGMGVDRDKIDQLLSSLGKRVFLMNNVHESSPVVFESRWVMSYLCGPLTREQIRSLPKPSNQSVQPAPNLAEVGSIPVSTPASVPSSPPLVSGVKQVFPIHASDSQLRPTLAASASVRFRDVKAKLDLTRDLTMAADFPTGLQRVAWESGEILEADMFSETPPTSVGWMPLPDEALRSKSYSDWKREFAAWLIESQSLTLLECPQTGLISHPDESERDFRIRLAHTMRESRDARTAELREKFARRMQSLESRMQSAQESVRVRDARAGEARMQSMLSVGMTLLGAFMGRKKLSATTLSKAGTAVRGVGRSAKVAGDVEAAKEKLAGLMADQQALELELQNELDSLIDQLDPHTCVLESKKIRPQKTGTSVNWIALAWLPVS